MWNGAGGHDGGAGETSGRGREDVNWAEAGSRISIPCSQSNFLLLFHQSPPVKMTIAGALHPD